MMEKKIELNEEELGKLGDQMIKSFIETMELILGKYTPMYNQSDELHGVLHYKEKIIEQLTTTKDDGKEIS